MSKSQKQVEIADFVDFLCKLPLSVGEDVFVEKKAIKNRCKNHKHCQTAFNEINIPKLKLSPKLKVIMKSKKSEDNLVHLCDVFDRLYVRTLENRYRPAIFIRHKALMVELLNYIDDFDIIIYSNLKFNLNELDVLKLNRYLILNTL